MISLSRYSALLERREMRQVLAASILGRLPIGLTGLAILLFVQSATASFARGGAATACYVIGLASLAPVLGRLIDRKGPRLTLLASGIVFPAALGVLVFSVDHGASAWLTLALAAAAGASFPPITACMRSYFRLQLTDDALLSAAYSVESVLIESIFIVGPMLVALFVAMASAALAVLFAALCGLFGTLVFLRSSALKNWRVESRASASLLGPLGERGFIALIGVILCYSLAFGLIEIGLAAYASERDNAPLAGVFLGLMSAGSALGGLAYGSRSWHFPLTRQFAAMLALMGTGLLVLALPWATWAFTTLCVVAGVVMAPALIIQSVLVAKIARAEHVTEAFTWSASALLSGVGMGVAAGGALLEYFSSQAVLAAAAGAALLAAAGACFLKRA